MIDPIIGGAVISGVGNLVGGLLGSSSARQTNQKQIDMTYDLTKNKHKYAMEDLKRSGLNPLLAATTPSNVGSAPKLENPGASMQKGIEAAAHSALDVGLKRKSIEKLDAEINKTVEETRGSTITNDLNAQQKGIYEKLYGYANQGLSKLEDIGSATLNNAKVVGKSFVDDMQKNFGKNKDGKGTNPSKAKPDKKDKPLELKITGGAKDTHIRRATDQQLRDALKMDLTPHQKSLIYAEMKRRD